MVAKFKTLVLGASTNPERFSSKSVLMLINSGIEVVALGKSKGKIHGIKIENFQKYYKNVHTITLYISPKNQDKYFSYILKLDPARVIFNPGTENPILFRFLEKHSISYELSCTIVLISTNQYKSQESNKSV